MGESRQGAAQDRTASGQVLRRVLLSASALGLLAAAGKIIGFLEKLFQAGSLGTSAGLDAYLVAISIPTSMFVLTREIIEPAFLPVYLALKQERGLIEARRFAATIAVVLLACGGLVVLPILLRLDWTVRILAPGLTRETADLAVRLGRNVLPVGIALSLSALTGILLNAHKRFALPAAAELFQKALLATAFALAVPRWGVSILGPAFVLACLVRLSVQLPGCFRTGGIARPYGQGGPATAQALRLAAPLALGMLFSQIGTMADNHFASRMGPGVISALSFGRKLLDLPLLLVPYSISVVAFPYFADLHIRGDREASRDVLLKLLGGTAILFAWITVLTIPLSHDIVRVVFERGAFRARSVELTAPILAFYAVGLVPLAIESILVQHFFARRDVVRPVAVGIAGVLIHLLVLLFTWSWLGPRAIALSYICGKTVKVVALLLWSRDRSSRPRIASRFILRLFAVTLVSGAAAAWISSLPMIVSQKPLLRLCAVGTLATILYGALVLWLRIVPIRSPFPPTNRGRIMRS